MKRIFTLFALIIVLISCNNSNTSKILENKVNKQDSIVIKNIFNTVLTNGQSYQWLDYLSNEIGGRLSGSHESIAAILWGERLMLYLRFDKVWLQDVMVPNWYRGEKEEANFTSNTVKYLDGTQVLGLASNETVIQLLWAPQKDITVHELAQCIPWINNPFINPDSPVRYQPHFKHFKFEDDEEYEHLFRES